MKKLVILLILTLLFSTSCTAPIDAEPTISLFTSASCPSLFGKADGRQEKPAFKGLELYSWKDEQGDWTFNMLPGTNRLKTADEVLAKPMTIAEVKACFCAAAVGEQIFWMDLPDEDDVLVPDALVDELEEMAEGCGVEMIDDSFYDPIRVIMEAAGLSTVDLIE